MRLAGKTAIITGAASGIGAASATLFAAEGAHVLGVDVDAMGLERTAEAVKAAGGVFEPLPADTSREEEWDRVRDAARESLGRVDVLFNNAGIGSPGTILETTPEQWDHVHNVNLRGTFLGCRALLPDMVENGGGVIINTSSELGTVAVDRMAAYVASKFAVIGLTKAIAVDFAAKGVRANALCPGPVDTPLLRRTIATRVPPPNPKAVLVGRFGTAEELARAALFLASDEAAFMTGAVLVVDGGLTAR
jgi:NAD(P)-dependent dehydrogenase (short-subunit alcohol dehydrogenase family)